MQSQEDRPLVRKVATNIIRSGDRREEVMRIGQ